VSSICALDPDRRISQYAHTAWRIQDGLISRPGVIAQTTDGYIWIGTSSGLVRFDGVRFVPWLAPKGQSLPSGTFSALLGAHDGSLWIGTAGGLSRWTDGQLLTYTNQPGRTGISAIIEDHQGTIWVTRYRVPDGEGPLCRVEGKDLHCYGKADGIPLKYGLGLAEDDQGNLWMGGNVLCRWKPGSSRTYFGDELKHLTKGDGVGDVTVGRPGSVWAAIDGEGPKLGVRHYSGGKWAGYVVPGFDGPNVKADALFVDRNKSLWIGTLTKGLYHIHDSVADHYGSTDGMSGDSIGNIYEDHEGNVWVTTDGGLDLFRATPVVSFSMQEGLSSSDIRSILALRNGSIWLGTQEGVDILRASVFSVSHELTRHNVGIMSEDHTGAVWLSIDGDTRLMTYEHGRSHEVKKSNGRAVGSDDAINAIAEDPQHNVWVLTSGRHPHLFRITDHRVSEEIPLSKEITDPTYLTADRKAGIWISSRRGVLTHYSEGRFQTTSVGNGDNLFTARAPIVDSDDFVWVPTGLGLFLWGNGKVSALDSRNGLPCSSILSVIKDNTNSLWLYARCGLLKIEASELAKWRDRPERHLAVEIFDTLDGARPGVGRVNQPTSFEAPDGRLWFINGVLAQMIDPDHLYKNSIPPPVHIEEIIADHNSYEPQEHLRLPPLTHELEIDYTALSFSIPRKVRFRYKLEGKDPHWEEPGARRQAFYSDLGPGKYQFRVVACNNDGVWNEIGATLDFSIAPAWYQANWFRILCVAIGVIAVWFFYRLRVRQIAKTISDSFDERLAERNRLARELHDTLLQTIQGSKMVADDALDQPADPDRMRRAVERLSEWLGQAMLEVRTALNSLRTSTTQMNDLAESLRRASEDSVVKGLMKVTLSVTGTAREMHPIVRDEIYRIGYEAIRNADVHSGASQLEVELAYFRDLTMRIRDNGIGIDRLVVEQGREGHFGLRGMRERAARIGAKLTLVSSASSGTEITLMVPGGIVFRKSNATAFKKIKTVLQRVGSPTKLD
jgi:ligand-binding sensor domain-containing protein